MHVSTLYDPLRLSCGFRRKVHRKIEALQAESAAGSVSSEGPRAFRPAFTKPSNGGNTRAPPSAFIGFMLSLGYPAQAHANHEYLKKFLREPDQSSCGIAILLPILTPALAASGSVARTASGMKRTNAARNIALFRT